jgi:anti-anti-sigma factor
MMQVPATRHGEVTVARPEGRVDHANAQAFESALQPLLDGVGAGSALILDLSALEYISSVGLRVFMVAERQLRERKAHVVVAALNGVVKEIFAISRFDRVLGVANTVDEALASLQARP